MKGNRKRNLKIGLFRLSNKQKKKKKEKRKKNKREEKKKKKKAKTKEIISVRHTALGSTSRPTLTSASLLLGGR